MSDTMTALLLLAVWAIGFGTGYLWYDGKEQRARLWKRLKARVIARL
jgi:hypothetical protein